MSLLAQVRKRLGFSTDDTSVEADVPSTAGGELVTDGRRRLYVTSGPADAVDVITPSDAAPLSRFYRGFRFDVGGTVKVDFVTGTGGSTLGVTRNVAAGEVPPWGAAVTKIYATGTTASGIDGLV